MQDTNRARTQGGSDTPWAQGLMNVKDAATYCRVSIWTIRRLIAKGSLPHRRLGRCIRIHPKDLEELLEEARVRREDS